MPGDSFEFRGVNLLEEFNIKCVKTDFISPKKRVRKTSIPKRHGLYDHGAINWEERIIRMDCDLLKPLSRGDMREITYLLSKKGKLYLWDEPDKYYVAEVYDPAEIFEFPKQSIRTFTLEFVCEPFAYREETYFDLEDGMNDHIKYIGTESAPCTIILENAGDSTIENITILARTRRDK